MRKKTFKNRSKGNTDKVVTGVLVGGVIGAAVGLLMAPASGEETRSRLKGEARGARQRLKNAAGNIEDRTRELADEVENRVGNIKESVTDHKRAGSTNS